MSTSNSIAKNTLFLYVRMFLTMAVSLYTSRVVLNVLGVDDFGIYGIIGGIIMLFAFLNSAMSSATQRFLAIDIGKKDWNRLSNTFNATLIIHLAIGLLIVLLGETLGLWFLKNKLNIPSGRINAAIFVYHFSLLSTAITIVQVPFNALIIARERMNVFAVLSIVEVILKLLIVYLLYVSPFDKLETYAVLLFMVTLLVSTFYKIYCLKNFKESKFRWWYDKDYYAELISYSGWNLFGNVAVVAKGQGINVILNILFGTTLNLSLIHI